MKPTRLLTRGLATALALAPMLAVTVQASPPPEPEALRVEVRPLEAPARVEAIIPVQGRLMDASGNPVADADYDMTFRVYDGSGVQCNVGPTAVHTERGLFNANLSGCSPDIFDGRFLTVGVQVGGDAEMTPVLVLRPVPYAMSLRPGAIVANSENFGHGLTVKGSGPGFDSALYTENSDSAGIAVWSKTTSGNATVVIENLGSGPLLKGFGGDGGEDEITITNEGELQVKPDSYVTVPGLTAVVEDGTTNVSLSPQSNGAVRATPYLVGGISNILIGVPVTTSLYGQQVDIESLSIFYRTTHSRSFITSVQLLAGGADGNTGNILSDYADHDSVTYAEIYLTPVSHHTVFVHDMVFVKLTLDFGEDYDSVYVAGVSLRVGHHPMY